MTHLSRHKDRTPGQNRSEPASPAALNPGLLWRLFIVIVLAGALLGNCRPTPPGGLPTQLPASTSQPAQVTHQPVELPPEPTATPIPDVASQEGEGPFLGSAVPVEQVIADLQGLPIDAFFEESYKQLLLREPQRITELGLADVYGMRDDRLNNLSDAYLQDTQRLQAAILERLRGYERAALTPQQQVSYDVYEWYLDMLVRGHPYAKYEYRLNHFINGYPFIIEQLFVELHPLQDKADAEDYIARLSQVDEQVDQLLVSLSSREQAGVMQPRFILQLARQDLQDRLRSRSLDPQAVDASQLQVYNTFDEKISTMEALSEQEKAELRQSALQQIQTSYIPAHIKLLEHLDEIEPKATNEAGLGRYPDGEAYYAYLLHLETSTNLTPEQVHEIGLAEVERIKGDMRLAFDEMGYPQDAPLSDLIGRAWDESGIYPTRTQNEKDFVLRTFESLLSNVEEALAPSFDLFPQGELEIIADPGQGPAFYVPGSLDGSRPGAFHISLGGEGISRMAMPTVAYHEAIPGHHFQIAIARQLGLPTFRHDIPLNGEIEGWALYAERLAWELGMYKEDPYGNIARLQYELLRAVRLVADTGIHSKGWTRDEARTYMVQELGGFTSEVDRYVVMPAQATSYMIGMLKILELRQLAMDELGDQFDLMEFHHVLLSNGPLPLEILERVVKEYIASEKDSG